MRTSKHHNLQRNDGYCSRGHITRRRQFVLGALGNLLLFILILGLLQSPNVSAQQSLSAPLPFEPNHCFAIADELPNDRREDTLLKVNPSAQAPSDQVIEIGRTGTVDVETIMLGPDDVLYGVDRDRLVRLDTRSGRAIHVGGSVGTLKGYDGQIEVKDVDGLAFNNRDQTKSHQMIGVRRRSREADLFFWIDTSAGQAISSAYGDQGDYVAFGARKNESLRDVDDLVFHPETGQLWGIANNRGSDSTLVRIDVASGEYKAVGQIVGTGREPIHDIEGITFWYDGDTWKMLGSTGENAKIKDYKYKNTLFEIEYLNPSAETIFATKLFTFPDAWKDIEGLACPFEPDPPPTITPTDTPTSTPTPPPAAIDLEKYTHGPGQKADDADVAPGPVIEPEMPVYWTYVVTNIGGIALKDVRVTDDKVNTIFCPQSTLAVGESMTCVASGSATAGQYKNIGSVTGNPVDGSTPVSDQDPSHYIGVRAAVELRKEPEMKWSYRVSNPGKLDLHKISFNVSHTVKIDCGGQDHVAPGGNFECSASGPESEYVKEVVVSGWTLDDSQQVTTTIAATQQLIITAVTDNNPRMRQSQPIGTLRETLYTVHNQGAHPIRSLSGLVKQPGGDDSTANLMSCDRAELASGQSTTCRFNDSVDVVMKRQIAVFQAKAGDDDVEDVRTEEVDLVMGYKAQDVSGRIYRDDRQFAGEAYAASPLGPGVANANVELFNSHDELQEGAITPVDGRYNFSQLPPGDYYLTFDHKLPNTRWAKPNQGADDNLDSDAVDSWAVGPHARSHYFRIDAGGTLYNPTWDAGVVDGYQVYAPIITQ